MNPQNQATPQAAAPAPLPNVPASWPGAFGAYKYSKGAVRFSIVTYIGFWLIGAVIIGIVEVISKQVGGGLSFLVDAFDAAAFALILLAGVRRQKLSIGQVFNQILPLALKIILLNLLIGVSLVISFLLLIIPFFFVAPRLTLANYFLVDQKLGVMEAYKASWRVTHGNVGKVWGIIGVNILMALLCVTIIGIPFAIYFLIMYSGASAVLYEFLNKSQPAGAAPAATPTASASTAPPVSPQPPAAPTPPSTAPPSV
jgi:hypothetical protein